MPFGIGFGELLMIVIIVILYVVSGAKHLPSLRERLIPLRVRERRGADRQWSQSDWLLVVTLVLLTAIVLGNAVMATAPRR